MMQGFTRICGFASFIIALLAIIEDEGLANQSPIKAINMYSITLPICFMALDCQVQRITIRKEYTIAILTKLITMFIYWALFISTVLSYQSDPIYEHTVPTNTHTNETQSYNYTQNEYKNNQNSSA
jgi:hypothetical protein